MICHRVSLIAGEQKKIPGTKYMYVFLTSSLNVVEMLEFERGLLIDEWPRSLIYCRCGVVPELSPMELVIEYFLRIICSLIVECILEQGHSLPLGLGNNAGSNALQRHLA